MFLEDIVRACDNAMSHGAGCDEQQFRRSRFVQAAVEREMSILGEAMVQALKLEPALENRISEARRIARFRSILIHAYDIVDLGLLWLSLRDDVPILRREAAALLAERQGPGNAP